MLQFLLLQAFHQIFQKKSKFVARSFFHQIWWENLGEMLGSLLIYINLVKGLEPIFRLFFIYFLSNLNLMKHFVKYCRCCYLSVFWYFFWWVYIIVMFFYVSLTLLLSVIWFQKYFFDERNPVSIFFCFSLT